MVFTYPSSYPLVESAALLRSELAALRAKYDPDGNDPLSTNMVVAGHSMGGMLTHTLVADVGDNLWKQFSDTPLDEVPIEEAEREDLRALVYFDPDPAVRRVVYFSAPHRGAYMATKDIAGTLAKLAKLPTDVMRVNAELLDPRLNSHFKIPIGRKYTSRESLEPGAPMVAAMDISPYKKGVIYHSVMGDRGKGDTPNSSDGVVEYWSSRQDGAASELIVPTDHGSYKHPRAIEELRRILRLHAGI
jgi:pimeloyl-ACP methyl ester carboxylesterase